MLKTVKALLIAVACLSLAGPLGASLARVASLGLVLGDSDWMVSDAGNITTNPALLALHTGSVGLFELNSIDNTAENVYGTALFKLGKKWHAGLSIGYPVMNATDLNLYRSGDPSNAAGIVMQSVSSGGLLTYPTVTPTILSPFASAATAPLSLDEAVLKQDVALFVAVDLDPLLIGLSVSYAGVGVDAKDTLSNVTNVSNSSQTAASASLSYMEIRAGARYKELLPDLDATLDIGLFLPMQSRNSSMTRPYQAAYYNEQDVSSYGAWGIQAGTTLTYALDMYTSVLFRFQYRHQDYSVRVIDRLDNNGDGNFMIDPADRNITDWHLRIYDSWLAGLSASHRIFFNNVSSLNVFVGTYLKLVRHDIRSLGTRGDNNAATTGDNYVDPYDLAVTETLLPIVIGGEAKITSWATARISALRNIVDYWSEYTTLRHYTAGVNSVVTVSEYERGFKRAPLTQLNIGLSLGGSGFTMDWLIKKSWFGKGGSLIGEEEAISTQFSISLTI